MGEQGPWCWHLKSEADGGHGIEHGHPGNWSVGKHDMRLPVNPTGSPTVHTTLSAIFHQPQTTSTHGQRTRVYAKFRRQFLKVHPRTRVQNSWLLN